MLSKKEQQLLDALAPRAAEEGVEIVTVEVAGAKKAPTIRVYIDVEGGVSFDELSAAQAWINDLMDELDPFPGAYTLEVSSPGIDRPLRRPCDFARFAGELVEVSTTEPVDGRKSWTGTVVSSDDEAFVLRSDGQDVRAPFSVLKRAKIKPDYDKIMAVAKKAAKAAEACDDGADADGE